MASSDKLGDTKSPAYSITVQEARCKGCAFCVSFCPKDLLTLADKIPVLVKPEQCSGCALCAWICPDFALVVSRREDAERPAEDER